MFRSILIPCALMALLGLACAKPAPPPAPPEPDPSLFSGERAWEHLEKLVEIGPRVSGTPGAEKARSYIRAELAALGLEADSISFDVENELADGEVEAASFETLRAVMPGESDDIVVLAAPYDSRHFESFTHVGANNGASGAALLLEMARVLSVDPIPYTVWFVFLDGDAGRGEDAGPDWQLVGSRVLVKEIQESDALSRLRLMVYFNQVADRDLSIARDLRSDRVVRKSFHRSARKLGHGSAFPEDQSFSRPSGGHGVFMSVGFRRVMLVIDDRFGGDEAPGVYWETEEDTLEQCDPESLAIVGTVTNTALRDVVALLRKVDRFSERPVPAPPPEPAEAAETADSADAAEAPEPTEAAGTPDSAEAAPTAEPPEGEPSQ
jgi:glutaminyl-peptide cyclotransferase